MTEEQFRKAQRIQDEIDQLRKLLDKGFRNITTVTTYNQCDRFEQSITREVKISEDLSTEIVKVIKDRLNRLQIEMEKL